MKNATIRQPHYLVSDLITKYIKKNLYHIPKSLNTVSFLLPVKILFIKHSDTHLPCSLFYRNYEKAEGTTVKPIIASNGRKALEK